MSTRQKDYKEDSERPGNNKLGNWKKTKEKRWQLENW